VPELDALLGGGLTRGSSTLIIGPAGSGKSTMVRSSRRQRRRATRSRRSLVFDEITEMYMTRAEGINTDIRGYVDEVLLALQQVDPAELAPGEVRARASLTPWSVIGARVVVIDSLNGYLNAMPEERFLTIQMHELLTYLNQRGVVTCSSWRSMVSGHVDGVARRCELPGRHGCDAALFRGGRRRAPRGFRS
jgi:circadian clock protein KaiC